MYSVCCHGLHHYSNRNHGEPSTRARGPCAENNAAAARSSYVVIRLSARRRPANEDNGHHHQQHHHRCHRAREHHHRTTEPETTVLSQQRTVDQRATVSGPSCKLYTIHVVMRSYKNCAMASGPESSCLVKCFFSCVLHVCNNPTDRETRATASGGPRARQSRRARCGNNRPHSTRGRRRA